MRKSKIIASSLISLFASGITVTDNINDPDEPNEYDDYNESNEFNESNESDGHNKHNIHKNHKSHKIRGICKPPTRNKIKSNLEFNRKYNINVDLKGKVYICNICYHKVYSDFGARSHYLREHASLDEKINRSFYCNLCDILYMNNRSYKIHLKSEYHMKNINYVDHIDHSDHNDSNEIKKNDHNDEINEIIQYDENDKSIGTNDINKLDNSVKSLKLNKTLRVEFNDANKSVNIKINYQRQNSGRFVIPLIDAYTDDKNMYKYQCNKCKNHFSNVLQFNDHLINFHTPLDKLIFIQRETNEPSSDHIIEITEIDL
jgi:hypothetical protein